MVECFIVEGTACQFHLIKRIVIKIFKFGGASVKDAEGVKTLANILSLYKTDEILIVVSAMGKTTNFLEKLVNNTDKIQSNNNFFLLDIYEMYIFCFGLKN